MTGGDPVATIDVVLGDVAERLDAPIDLDTSNYEPACAYFSRMALIREFENRVNKLFLQGLIPGTIHLSQGQEACAVGATASLDERDRVTITHRGHGQALAKGVSPRALMAELFARDTGCCRGLGGSLHIGDWSIGALPAIAIVGASVPIAAGLALAARELHEDRVVVCFTGDGAIPEGDTHEGLNIAALWQLPVIYLCENNLYSVSTRLDRQARIVSVAQRVSCYGIRTSTVDGNNVMEVASCVAEAVGRARRGEGPSFVECVTYRQGGHKRDDPATYRPREEVDRWLTRDPLLRLRQALDAAGLAHIADEALKSARLEVDDAVRFAEQSPPAIGTVA